MDDPTKTPDVESYLDPPKLNRVVRGGDKLAGVQPDLLNHWNALSDQFSQAGITPEIKSGYRTTAQQQALYNNPATRARTKGNDGINQISPHQEGRALDISFAAGQRDKGRQIIANYAQQNGLHVPSDEPWHIAIPKQGSTKPATEFYLDPQGTGDVESYLDPQAAPAKSQPKPPKLTGVLGPLTAGVQGVKAPPTTAQPAGHDIYNVADAVRTGRQAENATLYNTNSELAQLARDPEVQTAQDAVAKAPKGTVTKLRPDVQAKVQRAQQLQRAKDAPEWAANQPNVYLDSGMPGALRAGLEPIASGLGSALAKGAGVSRAVANAPESPLGGLQKTPLNKLADALDEQARQLKSEVAEADTRSPVGPSVTLPLVGRQNVVQAAQGAAGGLYGSSPELLATMLGVPAPMAFGVGAALEGIGENKNATDAELLTRAAPAAAMGSLYDVAPLLPGVSRLGPVTQRLAKGGTVAAGTYPMERAFGASPEAAAKSAITGGVFAGLHAEGRDAERAPTFEDRAAQSAKVEDTARSAFDRVGVSPEAVEKATRSAPTTLSADTGLRAQAAISQPATRLTTAQPPPADERNAATDLEYAKNLADLYGGRVDSNPDGSQVVTFGKRVSKAATIDDALKIVRDYAQGQDFQGYGPAAAARSGEAPLGMQSDRAGEAGWIGERKPPSMPQVGESGAVDDLPADSYIRDIEEQRARADAADAAEPQHHSTFQPRTPIGEFDGPPDERWRGQEGTVGERPEKPIAQYGKSGAVEDYQRGEGSQRERAFPKSLDESGRAGGTERLYTPESPSPKFEAARGRVATDLPAAQREFDTTKETAADPSAERTVMGVALIDQYATTGNIAKSTEMANTMAVRGTKLGQAVQAHRVVDFYSPAGVLMEGARITREYGRELTPEDAKPVVEAVKKVQELEGQYADAAKAAGAKPGQPVPEGAPKAARAQAAKLRAKSELAKGMVERELNQLEQRQRSIVSRYWESAMRDALLTVKGVGRILAGMSGRGVTKVGERAVANLVDQVQSIGGRPLTTPVQNPITLLRGITGLKDLPTTIGSALAMKSSEVMPHTYSGPTGNFWWDLPVTSMTRLYMAKEAALRTYFYPKARAEQARTFALNDYRDGLIERSDVRTRALDYSDGTVSFSGPRNTKLADSLIEQQLNYEASNSSLRKSQRDTRASTLRNNSNVLIDALAMQEADKMVYAQPNSLSRWTANNAKWLRRNVSPGTAGSVDALRAIVLPFMRRPANAVGDIVAGYTGLKIPFELKRAINSKFAPAETKALIEAFSQPATTTVGLVGLGYVLGAAGLMTSPAYTPQSRKPGALRFGKTYIPITRVPVVGWLMGMGAAWAIDGKKSVPRVYWDMVRDYPLLRTFKEYSDTVNDPAGPQSKAAAVLGQTAGRFVPSPVAQAAEALDTKERRRTSFGDQISYRIPGLREGLTPYADKSRLSVVDPFGVGQQDRPFSQAEKYLYQLSQLQTKKVFGQDTDAASKFALKSDFIDRERKGERINAQVNQAAKAGKLSTDDIKDIVGKGRVTQFAEQFKALSQEDSATNLNNAIEVYKLSTPDERKQIDVLFWKKVNSTLPRLSPNEQKQVQPELDKLRKVAKPTTISRAIPPRRLDEPDVMYRARLLQAGRQQTA